MKKLVCFLLVLVAAVQSLNARPTGSDSSLPSAYLHKMWVDFDVTQNGKLGMLIHVSFSAYDMKGVEAGLTCFFKYADGEPDSYIRHEENKGDMYHNQNGYLQAVTVIRPSSDIMTYDDLEVFMPYEEFKLGPGEYDLTIDVILQRRTSNIAYFKMYDFTYTVPDDSRSAVQQKRSAAATPLPLNAPGARFDSIWVEFDVKESDQLGMRMHFKFVAYHMKDTAASVAVYFLYNNIDGGTLKDKNNQFASASGNVAAYAAINPGYDTAYYNDLPLFMPYSELHLGPGNYQVLMDSKLIFRRGGLIANFRHYGFKISQQ